MQAVPRIIRNHPDRGPTGSSRFFRLSAARRPRPRATGRWVAVMLAAALGWLPAGCSSPNSDAPGSDQVHAARYVNPAYSAFMSFHGTEVAAAGIDGCKSCHGSDLTGTDTVPGCTDCHFDASGSRVPPGSGWIHGSDQHLDYADVQAVCNRCHDTNRRFGMPPAVCHDCHGQGINHILDRAWLDRNSPDFHGQIGVTDCANCHDLAAKCAECHFDTAGSKAPTASGWTHGNNSAHGSYSAYQDVCNLCHNLDRSYGIGPAACHDCHGIVANHALGQPWLDTKNVAFHGNADLTDCSSCHYLDTTCSQCHFGPDGSKAPPASGWTHGNNDAHRNFSAEQGICNRCHELDRSYGNGPAACHDCHGQVSSHTLGQPWLDTKSAEFHGSADMISCSSCHDLSAKCAECHFGTSGSKAPQASGWPHGYNPAHENYSANQGVCNRCHDLGRSFGNEPAACHDCHGITANHAVGQPWLDTKNAAYHGNASLTDCNSCHYLDTTCSQCHFGTSGSKAPPGSGWNHGNNNRHRDFEAYRSICNQCHTINRTYGNDPRDCHDCHGD